MLFCHLFSQQQNQHVSATPANSDPQVLLISYILYTRTSYPLCSSDCSYSADLFLAVFKKPECSECHQMSQIILTSIQVDSDIFNALNKQICSGKKRTGQQHYCRMSLKAKSKIHEAICLMILPKILSQIVQEAIIVSIRVLKAENTGRIFNLYPLLSMFQIIRQAD